MSHLLLSCSHFQWNVLNYAMYRYDAHEGFEEEEASVLFMTSGEASVPFGSSIHCPSHMRLGKRVSVKLSKSPLSRTCYQG